MFSSKVKTITFIFIISLSSALFGAVATNTFGGGVLSKADHVVVDMDDIQSRKKQSTPSNGLIDPTLGLVTIENTENELTTSPKVTSPSNSNVQSVLDIVKVENIKLKAKLLALEEELNVCNIRVRGRPK